ncbi:hypothetical protein J6590_098600 [Homalodisca vitripennis]|nr:hypothetical protein J6590_098600 [Homalodisca vitripennis]
MRIKGQFALSDVSLLNTFTATRVMYQLKGSGETCIRYLGDVKRKCITINPIKGLHVKPVFHTNVKLARWLEGVKLHTITTITLPAMYLSFVANDTRNIQ